MTMTTTDRARKASLARWSKPQPPSRAKPEHVRRKEIAFRSRLDMRPHEALARSLHYGAWGYSSRPNPGGNRPRDHYRAASLKKAKLLMDRLDMLGFEIVRKRW